MSYRFIYLIISHIGRVPIATDTYYPDVKRLGRTNARLVDERSLWETRLRYSSRYTYVRFGDIRVCILCLYIYLYIRACARVRAYDGEID